MINSIVLITFLIASVYATYSGNYALSFDGVNDYVTVPQNYQDHLLNDFWTLEAWIYPTADQGYWQLNIVGYPQRHPNMNYCGPGNSQCQPGSPLVQLRDSKGAWFPVIGSNQRASPNQWHHIAGTWNNATLNLYLDGVLDISVSPYTQGYTEALSCRTSTIFACDAGLQIGGNYFRFESGVFSGQYFRGEIDDVRVWKFARSQQEIQSTMNTALSGAEPGLLYYWRFDDIGAQITKSSAFDLYALLGGGVADAQPKFIPSTSPISAPPGLTTGTTSSTQPIIVHRGGSALTAGALIALFFLLGGLALGILIGWKSHGKRLFSYFWRGKGGETSNLVPQL